MTPIRFHLDEHVAGAIADGLRLGGIDVTTTAGAGLISAGDEAHIAFALAESRVIYTNDDDYLRFDDQGVRHAGIASCPPGSRSVGEVVRALKFIHACLDADDMVGVVEYL